MIQPPASMIAELSAWNNGNGISLEEWTECSGNFKLAVGYAALFWPKFVLFEDYIFRENFTTDTVRGFEKQNNGNKQRVEWIINHLHLDSIQHHGCKDISEDKIVLIGRVLKEIWEAKLLWQFPDRPCQVEFYEPEDKKNLVEYQLSFWQKKHEQKI
jgi:hypothetical protein